MSAIITMVMEGTSAPAVTYAAVDKSKPWLLSEGRPAYCSSINGGDVASFATDNNEYTQWGAAPNKNDQWLEIDLGSRADISSVVIDRQNTASFGVDYKVMVSDDELNWTTIYETHEGTGGEEIKVNKKDGTYDYSYYQDRLEKLSGAGGYVRLQVKYSKTQADSGDHLGRGASVRELKVYGIGGVNEPASTAENIAKGKKVTASFNGKKSLDVYMGFGLPKMV